MTTNPPWKQLGPAPNARRHLPPRLRSIFSLGDLEPAARCILPRPIFGYLQGGVEDNVTLQANAAAFRKWMFRTNVLVDVSAREQSRQLMGQTYKAPFGIAPMGVCALFAFDGDVVMARAAEAAGIPYVLSGASLTRMERVAQAAPTCGWFQAYIPGEPEHIEGLLERVDKAGFKTLVVTVDTATLANRENNVRVGCRSAAPVRRSIRRIEMNLSLQGKVVLVTGGSKGSAWLRAGSCGRRCARGDRFAKRGEPARRRCRTGQGGLRRIAEVDDRATRGIDRQHHWNRRQGRERHAPARRGGQCGLDAGSAGLANAWGSQGIRVNAINPGATCTDRVKNSLETESRLTGKPEEELLKTNEARIPLGRYAHPLGIANVAVFLASDCASYVTGALITMDGALTLSCARR